MATLFIIGNGFDKHHNLDTCYCDYRRYLDENKKCKKVLSTYPQDDKFWSDIESGLLIDYEAYIKAYIEAFDFDNHIQVINGSQNNDVIDKVKSESSLYKDYLSFTGIDFYNWLDKTYAEHIDKTACSPLFDFKDDDYFITFNYTLTLEDLYKIDSKRVLHIHGQLKNVNYRDLYVPYLLGNDIVVEYRHGHVRNELQFGNPHNNPEKMLKTVKSMNIVQKTTNFSMDSLLCDLECYLRSTQKDVKSNIKKLKDFVNHLREIDTIIIAGCSLGESDSEYYDKVLIPRYRNIQWKVYCYSNEDCKRVDKFMKEHKLQYLPLNWLGNIIPQN